MFKLIITKIWYVNIFTSFPFKISINILVHFYPKLKEVIFGKWDSCFILMVKTTKRLYYAFYLVWDN